MGGLGKRVSFHPPPVPGGGIVNPSESDRQLRCSTRPDGQALMSLREKDPWAGCPSRRAGVS